VALATKPSRIYFGRMKKGAQSSSKYVSLIGTDKDITKITSVVSNNKNIKVEEEPSDAVSENKDRKIKITVLPGMKVGTFREKIVVNTDHNKMKELSIHIHGEIVGNITVAPPYLYFGIFKKGERHEKTIRLKAAPGVSFKVLDVKSTTSDLIPNLITLKEGIEYLVRVFTKESFDKDILKGKIIIATDDEGQKNIEVMVGGRARREESTVENFKGAAKGK